MRGCFRRGKGQCVRGGGGSSPSLPANSKIGAAAGAGKKGRCGALAMRLGARSPCGQHWRLWLMGAAADPCRPFAACRPRGRAAGRGWDAVPALQTEPRAAKSRPHPKPLLPAGPSMGGEPDARIAPGRLRMRAPRMRAATAGAAATARCGWMRAHNGRRRTMSAQWRPWRHPPSHASPGPPPPATPKLAARTAAANGGLGKGV